MEVVQSEYFIADIQSSDKIPLKPLGTFIWVWHVDKIPPHIGISSKGMYFSLKASGIDANIPLKSVIDIIEKKKIKALSFELNNALELDEVSATFDYYSRTIPNKITCLAPIKDLMGIPQANKLTELLTELYASNQINSVVGYNVDSNFKGIKNYSVDDINERLDNLKNG